MFVGLNYGLLILLRSLVPDGEEILSILFRSETGYAHTEDLLLADELDQPGVHILTEAHVS